MTLAPEPEPEIPSQPLSLHPERVRSPWGCGGYVGEVGARSAVGVQREEEREEVL